MKLTIAAAPHLRSEDTTSRIMFAAFLALLPAGIWGVYKFGFHAALVIATAVASCIIIEWVTQKYIFKTEVRIKDGSAALTGLLMAYCLPPDMPLWQVVIGSFCAIFIAKECFGGIGHNIFNPALIGRAVLLASFPLTMTRWQLDAVTQATPLGILKEKLALSLPSYLDLFIGNVPGSIGEVSKLLLLIGALYLMIRKIITWHIPFIYVGTVFVLSFLFNQDPFFHILSGGLILGAFYMANDYVTGPLFIRGKWIFAVGCGLITVLIRNLGAFPEGVCYSILIMNMLVPLIDRYTRPVPFGVEK
jgi:electron transport complex protein RnfD